MAFGAYGIYNSVFFQHLFFLLRNIQPSDRSMVVYERGCLRAGEEWVEVNLIPVAGAAVGIAILQVLMTPYRTKNATVFRNRLNNLDI